MRVLSMRTRVGELVNGRYVYVFRAMVKHQRAVGEEEEDGPARLASRMGENFMDVGDALDPFKEPSPTQLARVEAMVAEQAKESRARAAAMRLTERTERLAVASEVQDL